MTDPSLVQQSQEPSQSGVYTFTFTVANPIPVGGAIFIKYPTTLTVGEQVSGNSDTTCLGVTNLEATIDCTDHRRTSFTLVMRTLSTAIIPAGTKLQFTMDPVTNPGQSDGIPFEISSYIDAAQSDSIDVLNTLTPSLLCNFPCKDCLSSTQKAHCTTCFDGSAFPYL